MDMETVKEEEKLNLEAESQPKEAAPILKKFPKRIIEKGTALLILGALLTVLAGIGSGWLLSGKSLGRAKSGSVITSNGKELKEAGVTDTSAFPHTVEGILKEGGIEGEGTHHLDRGLGAGKDVYLTSTVVDLQSFVDKKVQVWGETISGKHAGWLMDVGRIKVLD